MPSDYFSKIFSDALSLSKKPNKSFSETQNLRYFIKTLEFLIHKEKNLKQKQKWVEMVQNSIKIHHSDDYDNKIQTSDETFINKEMLRFSKSLRQNVMEFNKKLEEDEKILNKVKKKMDTHVQGTEKSIKHLEKRTDISVTKSFFITIIIFLIMYIFIRSS